MRDSTHGELILVGGLIVDGTGAEPVRADVTIAGNRIIRIDTTRVDTSGVDLSGIERIDCTGRMIFPGFIDTHSHLDGKILEVDAQAAVLRQGVTSVIVGQDGVSYAPGDGQYSTRYFASINGPHSTYVGRSVGDLLKTYENASPVNVGYLVPQGTVRHAVMGIADREPTQDELEQMTSYIESGMREGALGISTGLDYFPGRFASTSELIALSTPVRNHGGVYVSHLRGYKATGVAEAASISREAGVRSHISHYHGPTEDLVSWLEAGARTGADITFDAYPYARGCTNLSLLVLPPVMQALPVNECIALLARSTTIEYFASEWLISRGREIGLDADWLELVEFTYIADSALAWAEGMSISAASRRHRVSEAEFISEVMCASRLEVGATVPFGNSGEAEAEELAKHSGYMCGSDGIYLGSQPHPRGWGSFARVLSRYCRDSGSMTWGEAAWKLSGHPASRFSIPERGQISIGAIADLAIINPNTVRDTADYGSGRSLAEGVKEVLVGGELVLRNGQLTGATTGVGLRRQSRKS